MPSRNHACWPRYREGQVELCLAEDEYREGQVELYLAEDEMCDELSRKGGTLAHESSSGSTDGEKEV